MTNELPEPSEDFKRVVLDSGSVSIECELCGRVYFTPEMQNVSKEDAEHYENCVKLSKENPDKYIEVHGGNIPWGIIDGKQAVIDCKCNKLSEHERYIWNNRGIIARYLKARSEREKQEKIKQAETLEKVLVE